MSSRENDDNIPSQTGERLSPRDRVRGLFLRSRLGRNAFQEPHATPPPATELPLSDSVEQQNIFINFQKAAHLTNVFHTEGVEHTKERQERMEQFLDELQRCESITDRFELFIDDRYWDDVYTLDLGETQEAASFEAVEQIKSEYRALREKLVLEGTIEGELSREEARTSIHFDGSVHRNFLVGRRNRVLFRFEKDGRTICIAKRMTFLVAKNDLPDHLTLEERTEAIEAMIDAQDPTLVPVRTVYYATNKEIEEND